jgi:chromosome segregation ATPase
MLQRCLVLLLACFAAGVMADGSEMQSHRNLELDGIEEVAPPKVVVYKSPIKRVVELLRKMKAELEHEAQSDAEMYDKMVCWCETNKKEKTKAMTDADAKIKRLEADIASRSARSGALSAQMKELKKELSDLSDALKKATDIRTKGSKAFAGENKALVEAIANVKNAIVILSKHHSLLQLNTPLMLGMKTVLRDLTVKHEMLTDADASKRRIAGVQSAFISLGSSLERASLHEEMRMNRELVTALDIHAAGDDTLPLKYAERLLKKSAQSAPSAIAFLQLDKPPGYAAQSGQVYGMLKQMKSDFELALEKAKTDEAKDIADFEDLAEGKKGQIEASKDKLDELEDEGGENLKALTDAKEDLESTRDQRSADSKFLANLKTTCQELDGQWKVRSKTRSDELKAVAEALAIITEEELQFKGDAKFLQVSSTQTERRQRVAGVLRGAFDGADALLNAWESRHGVAAIQSHSDPLANAHTALAAITVNVQLKPFKKVKASIDKLVASLKKQQTTEVEFKAKCTKDLNANKKAVFKKKDEKEDLEASLKELATQLETLEKETADAKKQIADTQLEVKKASQNREMANAEFQKTIADQRATQEILKKALAKLEGFYKKKALLEVSHSQEPPVKFSAYKNNGGSSPVISMMQQIVEDSQKLEAESMQGEKKSQAEYEKFVKDANELMKMLGMAVLAKTKAVATTKAKASDAQGDLDDANGEIDSLSKVEDDLHKECDFLLKNFEIRQKARGVEIEALASAKAVLSGMKS